MEEAFGEPWVRKHDPVEAPRVEAAARTVYPTSLAELIALCRSPGPPLRAAGSHWALSTAAVSDHTFIETNDPANERPAMSRTLHNVIPRCMTRSRLDDFGAATRPSSSLVHVEAGKRIYQLYAELDQVDSLQDEKTLAGHMMKAYGNPTYAGPWAFETLGGAGGQTIAGAFSTGTHGGDIHLPPIADSVLAIHLVADGGRHYWIESEELGPLVDDDLIRAEFDREELGFGDNFEVIRNDDVFTAVLVSAGRFGVIYSVVLEAVPQYALYERRGLDTWQAIKRDVLDRRSDLYRGLARSSAPFAPVPPTLGRNRFLQVVVCLTPHDNFQKNLVGVTQRWAQGLAPVPPGRSERVGRILGVDPRTNSTLFELAGASHPYKRPDDTTPAGPTLLESACADASFLKGLLEEVIDEVDAYVKSDGATIGAGIAAVAAIAGAGVVVLLAALFGLVVLLREILDAFDEETRFGQHMENVKNTLLDPPIADPFAKAAGLFVWQLIAFKLFKLMQGDRDVGAISYAVMDGKNYLDRSCEVNVDSIEVFFDATDDRLLTFVDALIAYERMQEFNGKAFFGYASLRFMGPTWALIGMQKHSLTCAVEVAGLQDVSGGQELIEYACQLALNPNIGARLHWGQHNHSTFDDVERLYGDDLRPRSSPLGRWRSSLARLTDNGRLDRFSNDFSRQTGLEVVSPAMGQLAVDRSTVPLGETTTIRWDASNNPPGSTVRLVVTRGDDRPQVFEALPLAGSYPVEITEAGPHQVALEIRTGRTKIDRPLVASVVVTGAR